MTLSYTQLEALLAHHGGTLLRLAGTSIEHRLEHGASLAVDPADFAAELREPAASFVTLRKSDGALRGCIGSSKAWRPLVLDVAGNAAAAAFEEPRFPPLEAAELAGLAVSISVLTALEPMAVTSESELLQKLRPHIDGLVLSDGERLGLFLPQVWESLPSPPDFVAALKEKAGFPPGHWSPTTKTQRFQSVSVGE